MDKLRFMSKEIFKNNLFNAVAELLNCSVEKISSYKYIIVPVYEENKKYNSKDDFMRLLYLNEQRINNRHWDIDEIVDLFSGLCPLYPIWIDISIYDKKNKIIELRHSLRFRKPSQLRNVDTGHPPFKVVS